MKNFEDRHISFTHNITFKHLIIYINITFNDRLIYICLIFPFLLKLSPIIRFTHKQFLFRRFRFCCEKSVFECICLVILVGYSRSRTNIYLRDKVLDEKKAIVLLSMRDVRCQSTMPSSAKLKWVSSRRRAVS